jgi:hypothetical protein
MANKVPDEQEKQVGRLKEPSLKMEANAQLTGRQFYPNIEAAKQALPKWKSRPYVVDAKIEAEKRGGVSIVYTVRSKSDFTKIASGINEEINRLTEQLKKRKSQMSRMTIEEQQAAHQLNEQDRKRIAVLKEQITDEMPTGDWTKLSVPKMKYANALEFEKFLRGEGFKILRKDYMDRNTETKFSEFYAPLPEWNEANAVAVKGYKDYDIEAPTKKNGVVHY